MPLYREKTYYRDAIVLVGLSAASVALLAGATGYWWSDTVTAPLAATYLSLGLLLAYVVYRLRQTHYRLKITARDIKVKLDGTRRLRKRIPLTDVVAVEVVRQGGAARYRGSNLIGLDGFYSLEGFRGVRLRTRQGRDYFLGSRAPEKVRAIVREARAAA